MSQINIHQQKWELAAWAALLLVGIGLVFFRISAHSIWSDEAFSMAMADNSYFDILKFGKGDSHPPLYMLALKTFVGIFGHNRGVFRAFSAVGLLATAIGLGIGPVRRIFNNRTGLIFAFLMLLSSMNLTHAQETRMYTWSLFLLTAAGTWGYLYVRQGRRLDLILFGIVSLCGLYTHYYVTLGVVFLHLFLLVWIVVRHQKRLRPFLIESTLVALLFLPWVFTMLTQVSRTVKDFWITPPTLTTIVDSVVIPFAVKTGSMGFAPYLMLSCLALLVYGGYRSWRQERDAAFALMAVWVFMTVLGTVLVFSLTLQPILVPRYMLAFWGLIFMGSAWGLDCLARWKPWPGKALVGCFLALYAILAVPSLQLHYFFQLNGPMDDVAAFGQENFHPGQAFILFDEITSPSFIVQFPEYPHFVYRAPTSKFYDTFEVFGSKVTIGTDFLGFAAQYRDIWLVTSPDTPNPQAYAEVASYFGVPTNQLISWQDLGGRVPGRDGLPPGVIRFEEPLSDFTVDLAYVRGGGR